VIASHKAVESERLVGDGCIDGTSPLGIGLERLTIPSPAHFVLLAGTHEVVLVWIQRDQHPEITLRIHLQHEQVAIVLGAHLHLGSFTLQKTLIVADPDLDWWVLPQLGTGDCSGIGGEHERKEQRGDHSTSRTNM